MSIPLRTHLDHIVVGCLSVAEGVAWVRERLGVEAPAGGAHVMMSTHNHVLNLGGGTYLEIIAPDPAAPDPGRKRWFGLDDEVLRAQLAQSPRLITWVAQTTDVAAAAFASPVYAGDPTPMSRAAFHWTVTVTPDGHLPSSGAFPALVQWGEGMPHPTGRMPDLGCRLISFGIEHPEADALEAAFDAAALDRQNGLINVRKADTYRLSARIACPAGEVVLDSTGA